MGDVDLADSAQVKATEGIAEVALVLTRWTFNEVARVAHPLTLLKSPPSPSPSLKMIAELDLDLDEGYLS